MPQSECIRIRLKSGMTGKFLAWAQQIPNRLDEAMLGMHEQGILAEHIFLERTPEGDFLVLYVKAENLDRMRDVFQYSRRKLDLEYKEIVDETWDRSAVMRLEKVMDL